MTRSIICYLLGITKGYVVRATAIERSNRFCVERCALRRFHVTDGQIRVISLRGVEGRNAHERTIFISEDKRVDLVWIHYFIFS